MLWEGPTIPVLGPLDVTTVELYEAALNALRLTALALAFSAYALLLDHDRLVASAGFARRSALAVALATRLVPSLERDAAGLVEAMRGRGLRLQGARGYATLLSPLVAGSLERASGLAEAMEARGFGRSGPTRAPRPRWSDRDRLGTRARAPARRWERPCGSSLAARARVLVSGVDSRRSGRSRSSSSRARSWRCSAHRDPASRRCCGRSRASSRTSTAAASPAEPSSRDCDTRTSRPAELGGNGRHGLPGSGGSGRVHDRRERGRIRAREPRHAAGRDLAAGRGGARLGRTRSTSGSERPPSSRAASSSASALRRRSRCEPQLLLLDEPTSQLDPDAAELFLAAVERLGAAVVLSEQRVGRALQLASRVLFVEAGRLLLDAPVEAAREWLAENRPRWTSASVVSTQSSTRPSETVVDLRDVAFAYRGGSSVLDGIDLSVGRGEIVALSGANGSGKTTLAKLAAGLLEPDARLGRARRAGRLPLPGSRPLRRLRDGAGRGRACRRRRRGACPGRSGALRARLGGLPPSARPLERRARAARDCGGRGRRAGSPRPRRADARSRSRPQGGARPLARGVRRRRPRRPRRDARPRPPGAPPNRTWC